MKTRWSALVAFLTADEDPLSLALVRIVACTTVAAHVGRFVGSGAADFALRHGDYGGLGTSHGWLEVLGGADIGAIRLLGALCVVAAVCSALGLFTRPALIVTWLSLRALSGLNGEAKGSYDALLVDTLFVLMLSGCGRTLSLDARFFPRKRGPAARWPRILLVVQMGLLYLGSGLNKASSGWVPGGDATALWYILQQPTWARFPSLPLWTFPITRAATTVVWLFEMSAPIFVLAVLLRETAPTGRVASFLARALDRARFVEIFLVLGFFIHIGIEVTMEVAAFSFASLALYPAAIEPTRLRALVDRGIARVGVWLPALRPPEDRPSSR